MIFNTADHRRYAAVVHELHEVHTGLHEPTQTHRHSLQDRSGQGYLRLAEMAVSHLPPNYVVNLRDTTNPSMLSLIPSVRSVQAVAAKISAATTESSVGKNVSYYPLLPMRVRPAESRVRRTMNNFVIFISCNALVCTSFF